jgi:hypothetical protein
VHVYGDRVFRQLCDQETPEQTIDPVQLDRLQRFVQAYKKRPEPHRAASLFSPGITRLSFPEPTRRGGTVFSTTLRSGIRKQQRKLEGDSSPSKLANKPLCQIARKLLHPRADYQEALRRLAAGLLEPTIRLGF